MNFTVTRGSLQTQCLNQVLKAERPDVDKKRSDLLKLQGEFLLRLRHLEQSLLQALNEVKGRILDDDRYDRITYNSPNICYLYSVQLSDMYLCGCLFV